MDNYTEDNSENLAPGQIGYEELLNSLAEETKVEENIKQDITPGQISIENEGDV